MRRVACLCSLAVVLLCLSARADIIHLADGTTREGRIVEMTDKEVVVDFGQGSMSVVVRLPRAQVLKIEQKATSNTVMMAEYVSRLSRALKSQSADDWFALGVWCREQRCINDKAAEAFERALALDPNHVPTRLALGYVKVNDAWMTPRQAIQLIAPDLEQNAKLRELELQKQLEEAKAATAEADARSKALEAKLNELRVDIEDLRQRLALPALPADYYRPRIIYRPVIVVPPPRPPRPPRPPDKGDGPKEPPPDETSPTDPPPSKGPSPKGPPGKAGPAPGTPLR